MSIQAFIDKWGPGGACHALNERQGAQQHFIELCAVLEVPTPTGAASSADAGDDYLFEKGTRALGQQRGFADVFKRGCFAWEYKAPGRPLDAALRQLLGYALALDNPPLLIVSDRLRIEIHTHFNGTPSERHLVELQQLTDPAARDLLRRCFTDPESLRPRRTNRQITEEAASAFAGTAERLRASLQAADPGRSPGRIAEQVSHFLTQCLFCFFAEDVGLLPARLFERLVGVRTEPATLQRGLQQLFATMRSGGLFGADDIAWFNGGLFQTIDVPPLSAPDVSALRTAAALDWSAIDPSIFGTLFERGLDPAKRSQLGAHYTDPATILRIVEPVVQRPLLAEWEQAKARIAVHLARRKRAGDKAEREASAVFVGFLEKLRAFRVLDPACGSGNFLYLALKCLKDIEHRANIEAEELGLQRQVDAYTSPANVLGIELNEYAAELARVTVWIGELQWRLQHGYGYKLNPVLDPLDQIENRDALLNADGTEAQWPPASVIVGNPPFVGDKKMRAELGDAYTQTLRTVYKGRVPGGADLVCYWFEKARWQIEHAGLGAAGFVATNSIRGGKNREVLDAICRTTRIFEAWSDEPWVNEGAAVRVSLVAFGPQGTLSLAELNGKRCDQIFADLSGAVRLRVGMPVGSRLTEHVDQVLDLTRATSLNENRDAAYVGIQKTGPFEIDGATARSWLALPNPNGRPNSDVVRPWFNGLDVARRYRDYWIVDFGHDMAKEAAFLYEAPFMHTQIHVQPTRVGKREARTNECWWLFQWSRPQMRAALRSLPRFIVTPEVTKHRAFVWLHSSVIADKNLSVVARADDATFGILHSRFHELWSLRLGTSLEDRPRYTPTTCFETFPFPAGFTPADTAHQRTRPVDQACSLSTKSESEQRTANSEQRTANSEQRTANSEQRTANKSRSFRTVCRPACCPMPRPSPAPPSGWTICARPGSTRPSGRAAGPRSRRWAWSAAPTPTASCRAPASSSSWPSAR